MLWKTSFKVGVACDKSERGSKAQKAYGFKKCVHVWGRELKPSSLVDVYA